MATPAPINNPALQSGRGHGNSGTTYGDYRDNYPELAPQIAGLHFDTAHDYRDSKYRKRHPNRPIRVVDPAML